MSRAWKIAILSGLALVILAAAYHLRSVFLPFLVALLTAYVLNPAIVFLESRQIPRMASIAGVYVVLIGLAAAVAVWAVPAAFGQASDFVKVSFLGERPKYQQLLARVEPTLERTLGPEKTAEVLKSVRDRVAAFKQELPGLSGRLLSESLSYVTGGIASLLAVFAFFALFPVYLFFLLKNLHPWWESFTHWIPRAYRPQTLATLGRIHRANMSFFRGQLTICLIEGVIIFVGLGAIGVHYPLLFGLLYAILSIIPYLGVMTMLAAVELFVLADTGRFGSMFWLSAGLFGLIQVVEASVLQPLILGKGTGLHPIIIILALLSAGQCLGLFGMLLAIPLASTLKILFQDYIQPMFEEVADLTRVRRRPETEGALPPVANP
ncbi:MAG TPA: AI-2E family transporter [Planctomycetota bacterium]|nr:AI-2E family transporter [Planctomycetota bacterium]